MYRISSFGVASPISHHATLTPGEQKCTSCEWRESSRLLFPDTWAVSQFRVNMLRSKSVSSLARLLRSTRRTKAPLADQMEPSSLPCISRWRHCHILLLASLKNNALASSLLHQAGHYTEFSYIFFKLNLE